MNRTRATRPAGAPHGNAGDDMPAGHWTLTGPDGRPYPSPVPGAFGGHRRGRRYGRLDCQAAQRAIARGGYVSQRVFFLDETTALAAGYRPCAVCLPDRHAVWKAAMADAPGRASPTRPSLTRVPPTR